MGIGQDRMTTKAGGRIHQSAPLPCQKPRAPLVTVYSRTRVFVSRRPSVTDFPERSPTVHLVTSQKGWTSQSALLGDYWASCSSCRESWRSGGGGGAEGEGRSGGGCTTNQHRSRHCNNTSPSSPPRRPLTDIFPNNTEGERHSDGSDGRIETKTILDKSRLLSGLAAGRRQKLAAFTGAEGRQSARAANGPRTEGGRTANRREDVVYPSVGGRRDCS